MLSYSLVVKTGNLDVGLERVDSVTGCVDVSFVFANSQRCRGILSSGQSGSRRLVYSAVVQYTDQAVAVHLVS